MSFIHLMSTRTSLNFYRLFPQPNRWERARPDLTSDRTSVRASPPFQDESDITTTSIFSPHHAARRRLLRHRQPSAAWYGEHVAKSSLQLFCPKISVSCVALFHIWPDLLFFIMNTEPAQWLSSLLPHPWDPSSNPSPACGTHLFSPFLCF